jgi:hypothetical protein
MGFSRDTFYRYQSAMESGEGRGATFFVGVCCVVGMIGSKK